jgi:hypothetical protein
MIFSSSNLQFNYAKAIPSIYNLIAFRNKKSSPVCVSNHHALFAQT